MEGLCFCFFFLILHYQAKLSPRWASLSFRAAQYTCYIHLEVSKTPVYNHKVLQKFIDKFREDNGTPLQYTGLENPMDLRAWWAAVHGVAKSQTGLSDFTFTFHFLALEKEMATHSSVLAWRIPGMGEPGGLWSMGSHRVEHDWSDLAAAADKLDVWNSKIHFACRNSLSVLIRFFYPYIILNARSIALFPQHWRTSVQRKQFRHLQWIEVSPAQTPRLSALHSLTGGE